MPRSLNEQKRKKFEALRKDRLFPIQLNFDASHPEVELALNISSGGLRVFPSTPVEVTDKGITFIWSMMPQWYVPWDAVWAIHSILGNEGLGDGSVWTNEAQGAQTPGKEWINEKWSSKSH